MSKKNKNEFRDQQEGADKAANSEAEGTSNEGRENDHTEGNGNPAGNSPEGVANARGSAEPNAGEQAPTPSGSNTEDEESDSDKNEGSGEPNPFEESSNDYEGHSTDAQRVSDEERSEYKRLSDKRHNMPITGEENARHAELKLKIEGAN